MKILPCSFGRGAGSNRPAFTSLLTRFYSSVEADGGGASGFRIFDRDLKRKQVSLFYFCEKATDFRFWREIQSVLSSLCVVVDSYGTFTAWSSCVARAAEGRPGRHCCRKLTGSLAGALLAFFLITSLLILLAKCEIRTVDCGVV